MRYSLIMRRLAWLAVISVVGVAGVGAGCSSKGSGGDASAGDGPAIAIGPCTAPLSQNTACASSFDKQVTDNPCDPDMATQSTCGQYKVWSLIVVGSDTCVYDMNDGGKLVGARSCGGAPAECGSGCIIFGIVASAYATCGAETPACPP
jgi:hypothetical protein